MGEGVARGQVVRLVLMLLTTVGIAALTPAAMPALENPGSVPDSSELGSLSGSEWNCPDLITPDAIGPAEFERSRMAEKLASNQYERTETQGYVVCRLGEPTYPRLTLLSHRDSFFIFDQDSGELALTHLSWEAESPEPTPTPAPANPRAALGLGPDTVTICLDLEMPIVEVGDANPEQWSILDIVGGRCWSSLASQVCFDCGSDRPWQVLVPIAPNREAESGQAEPPMSDAVCIDASTAIALSESETIAGSAEGLDTEQCALSFGHGGLCWYCSPSGPEPAPLPPAPVAEGEATAVPPEKTELACSDFLTSDAIGREEWERYGIAEKLRSHQFRTILCRSSDCIICDAKRRIDEADVAGDELYYMFDIDSGELLKKRINWRWDLPEHLPSPLISQQEAEALLDDRVEYSWLAFLGPGGAFFCTEGEIEYRNPHWLVSGVTEGQYGHTRVTVIDALTGEVKCHYSPC